MEVFGGRIATMMLAVALCGPAAVTAGEKGGEAGDDAAGGAGSQRARRAAVVSGGHDRHGAWLVGDYRDFQLRKRTDRATRTIAIELQSGNDIVAIGVAGGVVTVSRGGRAVSIDSAGAMQSVQELLGGSAAVFATRGMLSELEAVSPLTVPDMSLLSAAAFVASLVGDTEAPQRIADRFVEKHRGLYRQIRLPAGTGCWATYSAEVTASWDALQDCMADADEKDFLRAAYERIACNAIWLLRSESAYFEYLNCLSPLSAVSK